MTPRRDTAWFRSKVRELGEAIAALTPARRDIALTQLLDIAPVTHGAKVAPGAYNAAAKGNGR